MSEVSRSAYPWIWFQQAMSNLARKNGGAHRALYDFVEPYDAFVSKFISRPHGLDTDRPQDYLACILLVRSFRLLVGGLWLAASGYADLSPNIGRTIFEILVRLIYSQKDPKAAALGFFLYGDIREIKTMETELGHLESKGLPVGNLRKNLETLRSHLVMLEGLASTRGIIPAEAVKTFGKLNIRQACQEIGIERSYLVDYSFESGHVHERNVTTNSFRTQSGAVAQYALGPINEPTDAHASACDVFKYFGLVATNAAVLVQDAAAKKEAISLLTRLGAAFEVALEGWREQRGT
jgi:hypothetical protein